MLLHTNEMKAPEEPELLLEFGKFRVVVQDDYDGVGAELVVEVMKTDALGDISWRRAQDSDAEAALLALLETLTGPHDG